MKAETRGYPHWVLSPTFEKQYIDLFWKSEGIHLDIESIKSNATKRGLAKLCPKSRVGKLTEWNDRTGTEIISVLYELYRFLATLVLK